MEEQAEYVAVVTEDVERVARVLCERAVQRGLDADWTAKIERHRKELTRTLVERDWPKHVDDARAAIAALREPSEAMVKAMWDAPNGACTDLALDFDAHSEGGTVGFSLEGENRGADALVSAWRAGIDAMLGRPDR